MAFAETLFSDFRLSCKLLITLSYLTSSNCEICDCVHFLSHTAASSNIYEFSEAKIWRNKILKILKTLHIDILASGLSEVCLFPYLLICQLPSVPVGKPVESLPVLSCWWFRVFQDALVGVTSQASCHQPSKSTAVLRLLWWDGEEKWVSVWGEISCGALETCFLCHLGHIQHVLDSNYTCILHSWLFLIFGGVTFSDSKNKYGRNFRVWKWKPRWNCLKDVSFQIATRGRYLWLQKDFLSYRNLLQNMSLKDEFIKHFSC